MSETREPDNPERIYLEPARSDERWWCEEQVEEDWIEYIRADLATPSPEVEGADLADRVLWGQVRTLVALHADTWRGCPESYWLQRLMQEVGELASSLAGDHDDSPDHELRQVASIAINWLRHFYPFEVSPGNAWHGVAPEAPEVEGERARPNLGDMSEALQELATAVYFDDSTDFGPAIFYALRRLWPEAYEAWESGDLGELLFTGDEATEENVRAARRLSTTPQPEGALEERIRKLEGTFRHTFQRNPEDPDVETCAECGLNIRDSVHVRRALHHNKGEDDD